MKISVSGCIVMYNNELEMLQRAINSFLDTSLHIKLYLIDNSPSDDLKILANDAKIEYYHNPSNPGFGSAHNIAILKAIELGSQYHFVVNPDVYFNGDVISEMVGFMQTDASIGMMMPKILNQDGTTQFLPKLLPSPLSILWRKIKIPTSVYQKFINEYELRQVPGEMIFNAPILSGCFTLLNLKAIQEIGMYDDTYFMYFEDWDLSRRIHSKYKTLYFPLASVFHSYDSGANKSSRLFKIFIKSAITYFNKWGWFFDSEREKQNKAALSQFK